MNKYIVELVGTFFLVLAIGLAGGLGNAGDLAPFAIGSVLMAMIYAGGHISGAHYNPAVTLAMWMRGRCLTSDIAGYLVAQLLGAFLAALSVGLLSGGVELEAQRYEAKPALMAEFLFTFALCWVILNVATSKGTAGNSFYGSAITTVVVGGILTVGPISGAVFNPAVAVGISMMGLSSWSFIWVYLLAAFSGGFIAAIAFKVLAKE